MDCIGPLYGDATLRVYRTSTGTGARKSRWRCWLARCAVQVISQESPAQARSPQNGWSKAPLAAEAGLNAGPAGIPLGL